MSSSSFSPQTSPRLRSTAEDQEPFLLPRYQEHEEPYRSFLKRRVWLSRGKIILLGALLSLGVWGIIMFVPSPVEMLSSPVTLEVPTVDVNSIKELNATIIQGANATRWTVEIPKGIQEPLRPKVYRGICRSAHDVAPMARSHGEGHEHSHGAGHHSYYWADDLFLDPANTSETVYVAEGKEICETSLTYLLESKNAGFGVGLMGLWSAYGLAKREGRSFFVNDRDWAWGTFTSYFLPLPTPSCVPPPPHWLVPCPHTAKHLVVAPSTHTYVFGHSFADEFEDPSKMGVLRQIKIFSLVREGYEGLFRLRLRPEDEDTVESRKKTISKPVTSMHVRRGDKHALAWEFKKEGYIPLARYAEAARAISGESGNIVYASDDAHLYSTPEFAGFLPAQPQLRQKFEEREVAPIQPGFIAEEFWKLDITQRIALGRLYLRDLKILGELAAARGDAVCDGVSTTCRLIAVIMGWERAIVEGRWVNLDGGYDWSGVAW